MTNTPNMPICVSSPSDIEEYDSDGSSGQIVMHISALASTMVLPARPN